MHLRGPFWRGSVPGKSYFCLVQELIDWFRQLIDPEKIIQIGGLGLVTAVVFAETGLMIGFFLPGDSLLFTVGLFCVWKYCQFQWDG